jgi:integrase
VGSWLEQWLKDERAVISEEMAKKYTLVVKQFLACVGGYRELRSIGSGDVVKFRDQLLKQGLAPKTINSRLISLKHIFRIAFESGAIDRNPVALVRSVKNVAGDAFQSTFTLEQIQILLSGKISDDWRGLILAGFYTGARLMDLARLEWSDVSAGFIQFRQRKTGGFVQIPIHPEMQAWLKIATRGRFVFPTLAAKGQTVLSFEFARLVDRAGINAGVARAQVGRGRSRRRLTFHSLRHSFNSMLSNAGVSQDIRMRLTGHASREVNTHYTHLELATLSQAIATLRGINTS